MILSAIKDFTDSQIYGISLSPLTNISSCQTFPVSQYASYSDLLLNIKLLRIDIIYNCSPGCELLDFRAHCNLANISSDLKIIYNFLSSAFAEVEAKNLSLFPRSTLHYAQYKRNCDNYLKLKHENSYWRSYRFCSTHGYSIHKETRTVLALKSLMSGKSLSVNQNYNQRRINDQTFAENVVNLGTSYEHRSGIYTLFNLEFNSEYSFLVQMAQFFNLNSDLVVPVDGISLHLLSRQPSDNSPIDRVIHTSNNSLFFQLSQNRPMLEYLGL